MSQTERVGLLRKPNDNVQLERFTSRGVLTNTNKQVRFIKRTFSESKPEQPQALLLLLQQLLQTCFTRGILYVPAVTAPTHNYKS